MTQCPIPFTCPDIDHVQKELRSITWHLLRSLDTATQIDRLKALYHKEGPLEKLRNSNRDLRNWGYTNRFKEENNEVHNTTR